MSNRSGEAFYLRDEESGECWSPTALPVRGHGDYLTRHGFGYSVFAHRESGIDSELTVLVAEEAPVKLALLTLSNSSGGHANFPSPAMWSGRSEEHELAQPLTL